MSAKSREHYTKMVKQIGPYVGVRYLRNKGVSFEDAYEIIFGQAPRK